MSVTVDTPGLVVGLSDEAALIFKYAVHIVLCQIVCVFGITTNIINIICFVKLGFKDSVNISLLGLSVSDLGSLVTMFCSCVLRTPAVTESNLFFVSEDVDLVTTYMPHRSFVRVSSCMTAFIALERCLCITAPFKITSIITAGLSKVVTVAIFIIFFVSITPYYVVNQLDLTFSPVRNRTVFALVFTGDREQISSLAFTINTFAIPFGSCVIIVICTAILSVKLGKAATWRRTAAKVTQMDRVSTRNLKVAKMVVMVSALFISCFIPVSSILLVFTILPDHQMNGNYTSVLSVIFGLWYVLECSNPSLNIFIYYHMSSKFRDNFLKLFCRGVDESN